MSDLIDESTDKKKKKLQQFILIIRSSTDHLRYVLFSLSSQLARQFLVSLFDVIICSPYAYRWLTRLMSKSRFYFTNEQLRG